MDERQEVSSIVWHATKRLALGVLLIVLASAVLLVSDLQHRKAAGPGDSSAERADVPRVALFQYASHPLMDACIQGALAALAERGFVEGRSLEVQRFNAQADMATANGIARAILDGGFTMAVTVTTPCLQAMANANREGRVRHVFGMVTDPFGAGVGLNPDNPLDHPKHLVGIGTFEPVRDTFLLVKKIHPELKRVGTVWNPAEACSTACVAKARAACLELGMTIEEAQVENTAGVREAAAALVARDVEAIYVGGDNTVEVALASLVEVARQAGIPVFTNSPDDAKVGALLNLGANFYDLGKLEGALAADILEGRDPATVPIEDKVPRMLSINVEALKGLRPAWRIPDDVLASADDIWDEASLRAEAEAKPADGPALDRKWKIGFVEFVEGPAIEDTFNGICAGLDEAGLVEGRDYEIVVRNAQAELALLPDLVKAAVGSGCDMIYTITTPALQAAMQCVQDRPVLFALAIDPTAAGDPGTHENHRANVAGIFDRSPFEEMMALIRECLPGTRKVGTLYAPSEVNSCLFKEEMAKAAQDTGFSLVALPSNRSSDVVNAAEALGDRGVDLICQINDNLHEAAFPAIVSAARSARIPVFSFSGGQVRQGACVTLSNDHFDGGRESGLIAARVMRGESPAGIPYAPMAKTRLRVNPDAAAAVGFTIPESVVRRADEVVDGDG